MPHFDTKSFAGIVANVDKMLAYFESHGIHVHPDSGLGKDVTTARELLQLFESQSIPTDYPHHEAMNSMANVSCLSAVVLGSIGKPFEAQLLTRIKAIRSGAPGPLMPDNQSQSRDIVFEILCGFTCSLFASDVTFEEPDVQCTLRGERWGLACKAAYGKPSTVAQAIRTGVKQLNDSTVDGGFVVVQMTNVFPHELMHHRDPGTGNITSFHEETAVRQRLNYILHKVARTAEAERVALFARHDPRRHSRVRGILYAAHTVGYFRGMRAVMGSIDFQRVSDFKAENEMTFAVEFNSAWQKLAWPE